MGPSASGFLEGHLEVVRFLTEKGANPSTPTKKGLTRMIPIEQAGSRATPEWLIYSMAGKPDLGYTASAPQWLSGSTPYTFIPTRFLNYNSSSLRTIHIGKRLPKMFALSSWLGITDMDQPMHSGFAQWPFKGLRTGSGRRHRQWKTFKLFGQCHTDICHSGGAGYCTWKTVPHNLAKRPLLDVETFVFRFMIPGFNAASGHWSYSIQQDFEQRRMREKIDIDDEFPKEMCLYQLQDPISIE